MKKKFDKLKDLFERQKKLQDAFGNYLDNMSVDEKQQYTKDNVLGLLDETHEVLREINWKAWKKKNKPINKEKLKEELADTLHFYINLCLVWEFTSDDIYDAYLEKDNENYKRIEEQC